MNSFFRGDGGRRALLLVLFSLFISIAIAAGESQRKRSTRQPVDELFNRNCARCHGADGRGDTPSGHLFKSPDFTDPEWWQKKSSTSSTVRLRTVVIRGKGAMPSFGKKLTRTEINRLVERVRSFRKTERKNHTQRG